MNVLFLGRFYPETLLKTIQADTRGKVGFSNHNFEMSLIGGFANLPKVNLKVVTSPMAFSFPHNNRRAWIRYERYMTGKVEVTSVGFCNIAGINLISPLKPLEREILRCFDEFPEGDIQIVQNTPDALLSTALFRAISKTKRKVVTTLIIPDVPQCMLDMSGGDSLKHRLMRKNNDKVQRLSAKYDKYVYLTRQMDDFYHAGDGNYMVMEGLIDVSGIHDAPPAGYTGKEIILYTGTLRRIFGVMNLVEAFQKGDFKDTELWICGSGECAEHLQAKAEEDNRIKYFGLVDAAKARQLQQQATILANPRGAEGEYTKYSFPSKTIEYLLSGNTVIMNHLPGIPEEYDDYVFYPDNESSEAWVTKLREIMSIPRAERNARGIAAREFIITKKNASAQCRRIVELAAV